MLFSFQTGANIFKAIVGAGSFALPFAFANMGIAGGLVVITLAGFFSFLTILMLIKCKDAIASSMPPGTAISYVDIARLISGPKMEFTVYFLSVTGSLGVSAAYLVFLGETLHTIYSTLSPIEYMLILLLVLIPLCLLRTFKFLSYTSILGDIGLGIGLAGTLTYGFKTYTLTSMSDHETFNISHTQVRSVLLQASLTPTLPVAQILPST